MPPPLPLKKRTLPYALPPQRATADTRQAERRVPAEGESEKSGSKKAERRQVEEGEIVVQDGELVIEEGEITEEVEGDGTGFLRFEPKSLMRRGLPSLGEARGASLWAGSPIVLMTPNSMLTSRSSGPLQTSLSCAK